MHREGEQMSVRLTGGGPYGLRISALDNGPQHQLVVAKLHKKSKARAAGIRVGDVVLSINGDSCQRMSQETANHLIDYSYDLTIQLIHGSDDQIPPDVTSSFRHSPQPPASLSPSPAPIHCGSESGTIERSTATELFRHQVQHHDHEQDTISVTRTSVQRSGQFETRGLTPTIKVTSHYNQESLPQQPAKRVRWSGCGLEPGMTDEESGQEAPTDRKDGGREDGFGWRKWTPSVSSGAESDGEISTHSSLRQQFTTSTLAKSQPVPSFEPTQHQPTFQPTQAQPSFQPTQPQPSFQPTQPQPSFQPTQPQPSFQPTQPQPSFQPTQALPNKPKPLLWQPPSAVSQTDSFESAGVESTKLRLNTTQPLDDLVHEVVIWSSKPTEIEQRDGAGRKPLPWQQQSQQPESKTYAPFNEVVTPTLASRQKPSRWQPPAQQTSGNLEGQDLGNASKLPAWQPPQPTASTATERSPSWQPTPTKAVDVLTSERSQPSRQHRWQPTQPQLGDIDQSAGQPTHLEEPRRSLQDGSSSPVVTTLFLTRVVTDGSVVQAGSGSDAETTLESAISDNRKLYGDSSFYEDPEHKYPTIVEQIKMARKVAQLLTSPANSNARGQRMFLKRKEQASKWVVDTSKLALPHVFVSPPQPHSLYSPSETDHSKILTPGEVEQMRYYEEKSRHDVIPFDVCSMLAAELREEKGRGGRLFAKRRDKVDQSITHESNGLIRVPSPRPEQKPRYVPEVVAPLPAPVIKAERNEVDDAQPNVSVPVNRLKGMIDLPKPRITPWDSAVEYGTVEPAFEHLKGYLPYAAEPTPAVVGPSSVLDYGGRSQGMFREGQGQVRGQGRDSNQSYGFKRDEVVEDRRTPNYPSTYSEPKTKTTGVAGIDGSSGFLRQASAKGKGHRPVHFDLGSRGFT